MGWTEGFITPPQTRLGTSPKSCVLTPKSHSNSFHNDERCGGSKNGHCVQSVVRLSDSNWAELTSCLAGTLSRVKEPLPQPRRRRRRRRCASGLRHDSPSAGGPASAITTAPPAAATLLLPPAHTIQAAAQTATITARPRARSCLAAVSGKCVRVAGDGLRGADGRKPAFVSFRAVGVIGRIGSVLRASPRPSPRAPSEPSACRIG